MDSGIYCIRNIINNKMYIGSAKNFQNRKTRHFRSLEKNNHHSILLQRAYNKYGKENFVFEVLEECEYEKVLEIEQIYLDNLKPFDGNGYNVSRGATSCVCVGKNNGMYGKSAMRGRKHTEESKKKMSEAQKNKNHKKIYCKEIIRNENKIDNRFTKPIKGVEITKKCSADICSIPVIQYDRYDGNAIKVWKSHAEVAKSLNIDRRAVGNCCNKKSITCANYIWRKLDDTYNIDSNIFNLEPELKDKGIKKYIYQYDLSNNFVKCWSGSFAINKELKLDRRKLLKCCKENFDKNQNNHAFGYVWTYYKK